MNKRFPLLASFLLFVALCASITYWAIYFLKAPARPLAVIAQNESIEIPIEVAAGLFGGRAAKVAVASNFQLKGVIFAANASDGVAILGADGKPPVASRVNGEVMPGVIVKEVHRGYVLLSENGSVKRVELQEGAKNPMQIESPVAQSMPQPVGQSVGQLNVLPQRIEMPPPAPPPQMAPAMPPTIVVAPGQPPVQMEPPPQGQNNGAAPAQPITNGLVIPPPGRGN